VSGFVLALGMVIPVSGWAMERFGAKQIWMFSRRPVPGQLGAVQPGAPWPATAGPPTRPGVLNALSIAVTVTGIVAICACSTR
jgi:hypothetical protein